MATLEKLFDRLINDCKKPGDLVGKNGLLSQLRKQNGSTAETDGTQRGFGQKQP
jgi:hypothetical protein